MRFAQGVDWMESRWDTSSHTRLPPEDSKSSVILGGMNFRVTTFFPKPLEAKLEAKGAPRGAPRSPGVSASYFIRESL